MNLIWSNLEVARFICDEQWKKICTDAEVKPQTKMECLVLTAKILKRLGDFLQINDQF